MSWDLAKGPLSCSEISCRNSIQSKSPILKLMRYCPYFPTFKADRYILTSICDSERKKERKKVSQRGSVFIALFLVFYHFPPSPIHTQPPHLSSFRLIKSIYLPLLREKWDQVELFPNGEERLFIKLLYFAWLSGAEAAGLS